MDLLSPQPPEKKKSRKSRLGSDLRREEQQYHGRGSAWIGTGPSTTCARAFFASLPPSSGKTGIAHYAQKLVKISELYYYVFPIRYPKRWNPDINEK
jgi:hypothetical protein